MKKVNFVLLLGALLAQGAFAAAKEKIYRVTVTSNWNASDHISVPEPAHFSPFVAVSHDQSFQLYSIGQKVSRGMELVAELGQTDVITREINRAGTCIGDLVVTRNQFVANEPVQTFEVKVSSDHPYLSLVSMVAPSPDWFVGLNNIELYNAEKGFSTGLISRNLYALNAGTESGDRAGNYSINNSATSPKKAASVLTGEGFNAPFAQITIEDI